MSYIVFPPFYTMNQKIFLPHRVIEIPAHSPSDSVVAHLIWDHNFMSLCENIRWQTNSLFVKMCFHLPSVSEHCLQKRVHFKL